MSNVISNYVLKKFMVRLCTSLYDSWFVILSPTKDL